MSAAPGRAIDRAALVLDLRLGQGGQGVVHRVANRKINQAAADGGWDVVYKEYAPALLSELDAGALTAMVDLLGELSGTEGQWLCEKTAWPAAVVRTEEQVSGFLMRAAPDRFRFDFLSLSGAAGGARRLANLEFLLNDDAYVAGIGLTVSERDRLLLLADLAETLDRLHRIGISVGDLSPKNLLFTTDDPPECFLIDCDAMRLRGRSVLPQAETPDWELPAGEEKATPAGDVHKLALLAVRLIARDQSTTDPVALTLLNPVLGDLARRSLDLAPDRRPSPGEWAEHLRAAVTTASTTPAAATAASTAGPTPATAPAVTAVTTAANPAKTYVLVAVAVAVAIALIALAAQFRSSADDTASPDSASASVSVPAPSVSVSSFTPPSQSPAPSPSPPVDTAPAFDPASLDSAETDHTPLAAEDLLPESFTDSKDVEYRRNSSGVFDCPDRSMEGNVLAALQDAGCRKQVVGTYVDSKGIILVVVAVIPLADTQTAERSHDVLLKTTTMADWRIWCPNSGPGSELCDSGTNTGVAAQEGYYSFAHRYLLRSQALYISLSDSSTTRPWTDAAAKAAIDAAGPQNYPDNR